jgi:hypothetical protein
MQVMTVTAPPSFAKETAGATMPMSSQTMADRYDDERANTAPSPSEDMSSSDPANRQYRGFGSSISHLFHEDNNTEGLDACSLACCGVLQADQNRFLLTGEMPPTFLMRFIKHLLIPLLLLLLTCSCAYSKLPISDVANTSILITSAILLGLLLLFQMIRQTRLRHFLRKEMLWRKYHQTGADVFPRPKGFGEDRQDEDDYYQTDHDLDCATAVIGCYKRDTPLVRKNGDGFSNNALARCCQFTSMMCCGCVGYYVQCCGICAIAQEGRDIERLVPKTLRRFDYQTMQHALDYYKQILTIRQQHGKARFTEHIMAISKLSRQLILMMVCGITVATALLHYGGFSWTEVAILGAVLTYSWLLTYLVHWPFSRLHFSIDAVIKCFACGFIIAASMALAWETFVGLFLHGGMYLTMLILGHGQVSHDNGVQAHDVYEGSYSGHSMSLYTLLLGQYGQEYPWMYVTYLFVHAFLVSALTEEVVKYLSYHMMKDHPDFWTKEELEKTLEVAKEVEDSTLNVQDFPPFALQVRSNTTQCKIIIVAMVVVSLGFMCAENLLYVFVYSASHVRVQHFGMLARFFLPIHPVCAAWQAINVCRQEVEGEERIQIGRIIGPAIVFHGAFDYVVMLTDFLMVRSSHGTLCRIVGFIVAAIIATVGTLRVYWKFKNLQSRIGWGLIQEDEETVPKPTGLCG